MTLRDRPTLAELRMKDAPPPYYIAYEVQDRVLTDVSGRLGAVIENPPRRMRVLRVEVRVGAQDRQRMLTCQCGDPGVVHGDGRSCQP